MAVIEQDVLQQPPRLTTPPRRPAWWDWVLSVGWVLLTVPMALFEGFLVGESESE